MPLVPSSFLLLGHVLQTFKVSNVVDAVAGTVTNCVDFDSGAAECLRVRLTAEAESMSRLSLMFRPAAAVGELLAPRSGEVGEPSRSGARR